MDRCKIDDYKELLNEIENLGTVENLKELEARVIKELVCLVEDGSELARYLLEKLEKAISAKLSYTERNKLLKIALRKSVSGAFSAARDSLI